VFCWVLQTAETIVQGLNFPNLTPRFEKCLGQKCCSTINQPSLLTVPDSKNQGSEVSTMALAISFFEKSSENAFSPQNS
jgi:hypothetical protein